MKLMNDIVEFAHSKLQSESNLKMNSFNVLWDGGKLMKSKVKQLKVKEGFTVIECNRTYCSNCYIRHFSFASNVCI